jgi:hypothetical protein
MGTAHLLLFWLLFEAIKHSRHEENKIMSDQIVSMIVSPISDRKKSIRFDPIPIWSDPVLIIPASECKRLRILNVAKKVKNNTDCKKFILLYDNADNMSLLVRNWWIRIKVFHAGLYVQYLARNLIFHQSIHLQHILNLIFSSFLHKFHLSRDHHGYPLRVRGYSIQADQYSANFIRKIFENFMKRSLLFDFQENNFQHHIVKGIVGANCQRPGEMSLFKLICLFWELS